MQKRSSLGRRRTGILFSSSPWLVLGILLAWGGLGRCHAEEDFVSLAGGVDIPLQRHTPPDRPRERQDTPHLLWLPSEYGTRPPQQRIAAALAAGGVRVDVADLHGAYLVPPGPHSLDDVPVADIVDLIG